MKCIFMAPALKRLNGEEVKTSVEIYNVSREIQMFFSLIVLGHTTAWASAGEFGFQIDY